MPRLNPQELKLRLTYDYRVAKATKSDCFTIHAYRTQRDALAGRREIVDSADEHEAEHYMVLFSIKSMVARGKYHDKFAAHFHLLAGGNYPYSAPSVNIHPAFWSPHCDSGGWVCANDDVWTQSRGKILFIHWVIHVAHLLNFHERDTHGPRYMGFNPDAITYWRREMKCQPITPGLVYAILPTELTHGIESASEMVFEPSAAEPVFEPASEKPVFESVASDNLFSAL
ncbi:MAG: hypothetical protein V1809_08975 [Planctomycetota bacterium]